MSLLVITLRLLHIVLGAFWVGTLIFFALFLIPSVRDAGPDGAKVMAALQRRRFLDGCTGGSLVASARPGLPRPVVSPWALVARSRSLPS
jgi:hypothetical protein